MIAHPPLTPHERQELARRRFVTQCVRDDLHTHGATVPIHELHHIVDRAIGTDPQSNFARWIAGQFAQIELNRRERGKP